MRFKELNCVPEINKSANIYVRIYKLMLSKLWWVYKKIDFPELLLIAPYILMNSDNRRAFWDTFCNIVNECDLGNNLIPFGDMNK